MIELWRAYLRSLEMGWDANLVVAMRMLRIMSGGAGAQREMQRMILEKASALSQAQASAAAKLAGGGGVSRAAKSASNVYRKKVRANRRRLSRR
ncbi:MAG TPA: hypothetical protein VFP60_06030 [Pseudolabrys sp.]|nr:hypothetical protein [Pseudolabrys sp.]